MGKLLSMLRSPDTLVHVILASLHSQPLGQMYDDEEEAVMALSSTNSATSANRGRWRWEVVDDDATPDDVIVMLSRATARYGGTGSGNIEKGEFDKNGCIYIGCHKKDVYFI